ncbi:hypothetical protein ACLK1S_20925 [Escherichia coli]
MQLSNFATWGVAELNMKVAIPSMGIRKFRHAPVTAAADAFCDVIDRVEQALVSAGRQVQRRGDDGISVG